MKTWVIILIVILLVLPTAAWAGAVPNVLSFQSSLYDEGGNPIQDGANNIHFRIMDDAGNLLYEEYQDVDVVRGMVSVLIGNGLTVDGAPAGGLPEGIFDSGGIKYIDLKVGDGSPIGPMEIASVPYAITSSLSHSVTEGAIDSKAISDGGIQYEDLSSDLIGKLSDEMTEGREIVFKDELESMYRGPGSAAKIGVVQGLNYSGANDLQGVIVDMDQAIRHREERIVTETEARVNDVANLQSSIAAETVSRQQADASEASARQQADASEVSARSQGDSNLQANIDAEASTRGDKDNELQGSISAVDDGLINHNHNGEEGQGGLLFPGAIWFDAGYRPIKVGNDTVNTVTVAGGFSQKNCAVTTSLGTFIDASGNLEGIDDFCTEVIWNNDVEFTVRCIVHGGYADEKKENPSCADLENNKGTACTASYVVMCAKK